MSYILDKQSLRLPNRNTTIFGTKDRVCFPPMGLLLQVYDPSRHHGGLDCGSFSSQILWVMIMETSSLWELMGKLFLPLPSPL